jgi:GNAT superfamily N-acetyltransferase
MPKRNWFGKIMPGMGADRTCSSPAPPGSVMQNNRSCFVTALSLAPISPGDYDQWAPLWRAYLEFYETELDDSIYKTSFARLCSTDYPDQCGFLAWQGERAVGLVHYIYHPHNWRAEKVCYLQDLYAVPDIRGTGIGRALIERVYAQADADGCPSVYWMTQEFNTEARKLYDRIGRLTPFIKYQR